MLSYETSVAINRDIKWQKKRRKDIIKLRAVMCMLISEQPLLARYHNHPLHGGEWEGKWECYVEPNRLLVYRIDEQNRRVLFYRTGTHADLF